MMDLCEKEDNCWASKSDSARFVNTNGSHLSWISQKEIEIMFFLFGKSWRRYLTQVLLRYVQKYQMSCYF